MSAASLPPAAQARVDALVHAFEHIARTRMAGLPLLHLGLRVQAVEFEAEPDGQCLLGVLVTPWFMNLVRLPFRPLPHALLAPGLTGVRDLAGHRLGFIGASEDGLGAFEVCSLFSPMGDFADQAAAVATAQAALQALRMPQGAASSSPGLAAPSGPVPSRRGFLFGRTAGGRP